jgi:hypothetical protein
MINLFHLSTALAFVLHFSGMPRPEFPSMERKTEAVYFDSKKEDNEYIPWTYDRPLTWEDFQSSPKKNTDAVASASTSLGIAYQIRNGELTYQITCNFSKIKSWGIVKTDYILAHEQGHFDITEIFARKLYQELKAYRLNVKTYKQDINNIYRKIVAEKEAFQEAYDGQTDHSRQKRAQYEWLDRIDQILEETDPFADYP